MAEFGRQLGQTLITTILLGLLRLAGAFVILVSLLGHLWFPDPPLLTALYSLISMAALLVFVGIPRSFYAKSGIRRTVVLLAMAALFITAREMHIDLTLIQGADYLAFRSRLIDCIVFSGMFIEAALLHGNIKAA